MRSIFFEKPDPLELRLRTVGAGQLWVWLPVLVALAVIAFESTEGMSAEHTGGWLRVMFTAIFGSLPRSTVEEINHILRKSGHFLGYGLVCISFLRAWLLELARIVELRVGVWRLRSCLLAVCSTALIASADEWHQTFLPGRTGTPTDVLLDSCGAAVSCGLVWAWFWRRRRVLRAR